MMTAPRRSTGLLLVLSVAVACVRPAPSSQPTTPEALLRRAISYAGGNDALARARAISWNGEAVVHAGGRDVRIAGRWSVLPPDTAVVETYAVAAGEGSMRALVVAAPRGWTVTKGVFTPMSPEMLANERDAFYLYQVLRLAPLRAAGGQLHSIAPDPSGRPGFAIRRPERPDVDVYLDADGRVARMQTTVAHPFTGKPAAQTLEFEGTLTADGIRWPRVLRIILDGAPYFDLTMRDLRTARTLDHPMLAGPR